MPTVEWQVAGACNYDCSYCIQSKASRRGRPTREQFDRAIDTFAALPGTWEIKCSGGEAFAHPLFLSHVVPEIMRRTPHRLSVLTNFSAERRELVQFAQLTRGRLAVFSASLHLEWTTVEELVAKARWFHLVIDPDVRFVVNQVILPGREAEAEACRRVVEAAGVRWFPQLFKTGGGIAEYATDALVQLIGRKPTPRDANTAPSYRGRSCWAGVEYFTVDKDGAAWSCRTAKRYGEGSLGNAFTGTITLGARPEPCTYDICPCTVPANRGMIEGIALESGE